MTVFAVVIVAVVVKNGPGIGCLFSSEELGAFGVFLISPFLGGGAPVCHGRNITSFLVKRKGKCFNLPLSTAVYVPVMAYDPGALHIALAAAVGDDSRLVQELRTAFIESAEALVDQLKRARCDANWRMASLRLQGLAASFGAVALMECAELAVRGVPNDPVALAAIEKAVATFVR